jgi:hypothetical protein
VILARTLPARLHQDARRARGIRMASFISCCPHRPSRYCSGSRLFRGDVCSGYGAEYFTSAPAFHNPVGARQVRKRNIIPC